MSWRHIAGVQAQLHSLDGGEWTALRPCRFTPPINEPQFALNWKLGVLECLSGRFQEGKSLLRPAGNRSEEGTERMKNQ